MKPNLTRKAHSQTSCHCGNTEWQSNRNVALAAIDNSQRLHETTLDLLFSTSQAMKNTHFSSQHTRRNAHVANRNTYHSYHCKKESSSTQNTYYSLLEQDTRISFYPITHATSYICNKIWKK